MKTFRLILQDACQQTVFAEVSSYVGEDSTGSFGIMPEHVRFMTSTLLGLSRFLVGETWHYLATPGALLYFRENTLTISCRHFLVDDDYARISEKLQKQILQEELALQQQKRSLRIMEEEVLKRLWEVGRATATGR